MRFRAILWGLVLIVFCALINGTTTTVSATEADLISMNFRYNGTTYTYSSTALDNLNNFYFRSIAQKNNRLGTPMERADLLERVLALGVEPSVAFQYCFPGLEQVIADIKKAVDCAPQDALFTFNPKRTPYFVFQHEKMGYSLDTMALAHEIADNLRASSTFTIDLHPTNLYPDIYYDDIKDYATLRGSFFTSFNENNANRKHNIALAISKFNGLKIEKNHEYSFNETTGRRTEANGYRPANIIVDKKYVEGYGGGVCQASTTLYNALLLAGLDFREVHSHSLVSSYVNMGFDAMVNFGSADLRWVNNTDTDMFVRTYVSGNRVGVEIYGKPDKTRYTLKRVTEIEKEITPPSDEVIIDKNGEYSNLVNYTDESAYISAPHKGYRVRAILEKYEGDKLVERKLLRRVSYQATRGVKVVGNKERPKPTPIENEPLRPEVIEFWKRFSQV